MKLLGLALVLLTSVVVIVGTINCVYDELMLWQDRREAKGWWIVQLWRQGTLKRMW